MASVQETAARVWASSKERVLANSVSNFRSRELLLRSELAILQSQQRLRPNAHVQDEVPAPVKPKVIPAPQKQSDLFEPVQGRHIHNETVHLDGKHFLDCRLSDCVLVYSGQPMLLESTSFEGCRFRFEDEAAMTMRLCECFELIGSAEKPYSLGATNRVSRKPN